MRDVLPHLREWWAADTPFALATVVGVRGSAPRQPGASMAVSADGEAVGSVSGGCVEGAVYELATEVLQSGQPVLQTYGISDEDAFSVGLTCGGILDILVRPVDPATVPSFEAATASIAAQEPVAVATVISGEAAVAAQLVVWADRSEGTLGASGLDAAVTDDARGMLAQGQTAVRHYGPHGERRQDEVAVFVESFAPPPRMLVFGAIDFAAAVARIGRRRRPTRAARARRGCDRTRMRQRAGGPRPYPQPAARTRGGLPVGWPTPPGAPTGAAVTSARRAATRRRVPIRRTARRRRHRGPSRVGPTRPGTA